MKSYLLVSQRFLKPKGKKKGFASLIALLSILGIALGVMASIVVLSVMNGFQEEIKTKILGVKSHITIVAKNSESINDYTPIVESIRKEPGIVSAVPYIEMQSLVKIGSHFKPVLLRGVQPSAFQHDQELNKIFKIIHGNKILNKRNSILVGSEIFQNYFLSLNQKIHFLVAKGALNVGMKTKQLPARISGVFKTGFQEFDNGIVYISLPTLQKAFNMFDSVDKIDIKVQNVWNMKPTLLNLVKKYGKNFRIYSWEQVNRNFFYALSLEKTIMSFIMMLILLVASFNVMSAQLILVTERKKEIGILKTIGMAPRHIAALFLFQSLVITSIGATIGAAIGTLIAIDVKAVIVFFENILNAIKKTYFFFFQLFANPAPFHPITLFPEGVYYIDSIPSDVSISRALFFILASILLSLLASLVPSLKAARLKPIEVMRYEQ